MREDLRQRALDELDILDTPPERELDDLVRLASAICAAPISLVSLVDRDRQWFKAEVGCNLKQTHRDVSFCSHAIQHPGMFVVEDATLDSRFSANALVTQEPHIRFYAGVPLQAPGGAPIGTLCVIDMVPRSLNGAQQEALGILAAQVQARLELRAQSKAIQLALAENKRLCTALQTSNDLFLAFMNNGPFASFIKDADGAMIFYNSFLASRFGITQRDWIGRKDHELWPKEMADAFREADRAVLESQAPAEICEITPGPNGVATYWKSFKFPCTSGSGTKMVAGISIDVTHEMEREAQLAEALREKTLLAQQLELLATTDALTQIPNRRLFETLAPIEFAIALRTRRPLTILVLDVDNFKSVNDRFGHATGDEALKLLGSVLHATARAGDLPARIGGEEFAFLLPDCDQAGAIQVAERIRCTLRDTRTLPFAITVSIGIASLDETTPTWERLLCRADDAMYEAKSRGKDRFIVHSEHLAGLLHSVQGAAAVPLLPCSAGLQSA